MAHGHLGLHALIVGEETFAAVTELEIRKAVRLQYPVSVLALLLVQRGEGQVLNPRHLAEQLVGVVRGVIRSTDLIRLSASSADLHVLFVDAHLEHLSVVCERITEEVSRHQFQLDGEPVAVTLSVGGACFPATASTSPDLLAQAGARAREACRGAST